MPEETQTSTESQAAFMASRWSLSRMKALALGLLLGAFALYVLATALLPQHAAWGYVAAAAEAAMVGALADWFAVVALFRHPLGLPIPHTAIIVANKDRLGQALARFLGEHFLTHEHLGKALEQIDVAGMVSRWLSDEQASRRVGQWLQQATPDVLGVMDQGPMREWVSSMAQRLLQQVDLASLGGQALEALVAHRHHQQWLDELLQQLAHWAEQEGVQERLTDAIAKELRQLKYVGLDQMAARLATRKLVAALTRTLGEVAQDPEHELRVRFDQWMDQTADRLQDDADWQQRVAGWRDAWIGHENWRQPIEKAWHELMQRLRADALSPESALADRYARVVRNTAQQLAGDLTLQQWVNAQARQGLLAVVDASRESIVGFVAGRVQAWDAHDMSDVLEQHIGRDLQFIRINGTLVGALVGLALYTLTELVTCLPMVQSFIGR